MSKFAMLAGDVVIAAPDPVINIMLWGPEDTSLEWVRFVDVSGHCVTVIDHGRLGRRDFIMCSVDMPRLGLGDQFVLHGAGANSLAYNCSISRVPSHELDYNYSMQLGTLA